MAKTILITREQLLELLRYEPETGKLYWRERGEHWFKDGGAGQAANAASWNTQNANKEAFTAINGARGYKRGPIFGAKLYAHRVIWMMVHGEWPDVIDHVNGITTDNRLLNLRSVSQRQNAKNSKKRNNSTAVIVGVTWNKQRSKWLSQIKVVKPDGSCGTKYLGEFKSVEDAIAARKAAEAAHGYHLNHGRK